MATLFKYEIAGMTHPVYCLYYRRDDPVRYLRKVKNFLFTTVPRPALGSNKPPVKRIVEAFPPAVKRPTDKPSGTKVKNEWSYTSAS